MKREIKSVVCVVPMTDTVFFRYGFIDIHFSQMCYMQTDPVMSPGKVKATKPLNRHRHYFPDNSLKMT